MNTADPANPNPGPVKETSATKDVVVIIIVLLVLFSGIVGLVYGVVHLVKSSAKPGVTQRKVETATPAMPAPQAKPAPVAKTPVSPKENPSRPVVEKPVAPSVAPPVAAAVLELGRDLAAVRDIAEVRVSGFDLKQVKVTVGKAKKDAQVRIPVGVKLTPATATNICAYMVSEPRTVNVSAAGAEAVVYVPVVGLDFHYLHVPVNSVELTIAAPPEQDPAVGFLAFAAARTSSWNTVQTGIWALENNISRQELSLFRLAYPDPSVPGGVRQEPLASYVDIKNVEAMFSALGKDPDAYKLIVEEREERNRLVSQVNFDKPSPAFLSILRNQSLTRYVGDSEVDRILRQYLGQHRRYDVRRLALENLLALGLMGSPNDIFQKAMWDHDMNMRLVAATTLARAGDGRGLPILAACADDPILAERCSASAEAAIRKVAGQPRNPGEGMLAYWTRTVGWNGLKTSRQETENLKRALDAMSPKSDAALTQALADIVSADESKASAACHTLARYPRSQTAFDALCRTALQPRSADIRRTAIQTLRSFPDFAPARMCEQIVKQGDEQLTYAVLNLISGMQFSGFEAILLQAARQESPSIRREVVQIMGNAKVMEAEKELVKMAQYDADAGIQDTALYALSVMRSQDGLNLCLGLLRSGERNSKYRAWRCLQVWENDPAAIELMQKYKNDPDLGQQIAAHLARYAK